MFFLSLILFGIGSLGAGIAPDATCMIAARFVNVANQLGGAFGMALMVMATDGIVDGTECFRISRATGLVLVLSALGAIAILSQQPT
mgnify:CR=1 FL=1